MALERVPDGYQLTDEEGTTILFRFDGDDLPIGTVLADFGSNLELRRETHYFTMLHWHHGNTEVERFAFEVKRNEPMPLAWRENLAGHRISVEYDAGRHPVRIRQELEQRTVELAYNSQDLISSISIMRANNQRKILVSYEYDNDRNLITATDALGNRTCYAYDRFHRLVRETNPLGSSFSFSYDRLGRCNYTTGDGRYMERRLEFHSTSRMTRVTDSLGDATEYYMNSVGQVIQEVGPLGSITTSEYDEFGRYTKVIYADGGAESYAYDEHGNLVSLVDECGGEITLKHNHLHLSTELVDPEGAKWLFEYDNRGNLLAVVNPLGYRQTYGRDNRNLVTEAEIPGGLVFHHRYDPDLRWQETSDQISLIDRIEYDEFGNATALYDTQGMLQRIQYDDLNRIIALDYPDGTSMRFKWNALSEVVEKTGPGSERQYWEYDAFGQTASQTNPLGVRMQFEYDTEGRLVSLVNRAKERMRWVYDAESNLVEEQVFDGRVQHYAYTPTGDCAKVFKADGRTISQRYDKCGRIIARHSSDGLQEEFVYNRNGNMTLAQNNYGAVEFEWDILGRLVAEVQNGRRLEYGYDSANNQVSRRLLGIERYDLKMTFDVRGRLTTLADSAGPCQELRWDSLDRIVDRRSTGGAVEVFSYDPARRFLQQTVMSAWEQIRRRYSYDEKGNVASLEEQRIGTSRFEYDEINRLIRVHQTDRHGEYYRYDAIGSIVETHLGHRTVMVGGKTLDDESRSYVYDNDGCISQIQKDAVLQSLRFDVNGNLLEVASSDAPKVVYTYDALGRRTSKQVGDQRTEFLWTGSDLAAEIRDTSSTTLYFLLDKEPLVQWQDSQRFFPVVEPTSGAVRELLSEQGEILWECTLDAYGNLLSERGTPSVPFRFRGQYHDRETSFYYNFYRTYDPRLGGYLSPDPIGLEGGSNFYLYPRNPLLWDDPFGLKCGTNQCKGKKGESRMDKHYKDRGYTRISKPGRARGIDGVYYKKGGKPPYIIVEAKFGSSELKRTKDGNKQLSDGWVDSKIGGTGKDDRLTAAVGKKAADRIRDQPAEKVGKEVFRAPEGRPGYSEKAGDYDAGSGDQDIHFP
jgi:RHS repeat-associated protein